MKNYFLITGCSGFLGKELIKLLIKKKLNLILLSRKKKLLKKIFKNKKLVFSDYKKNSLNSIKKFKIIGIVHLATCYGKQHQTKKYIYNVNYNTPIKILNILSNKYLKYYINTDTYYSEKIKFNDSRDYYVKSKKNFLKFLKLNFQKLKIINLKIFHMYGPNDRKDKFLPIIINKLKKNKKIDLTSGNQILDFVHVNDVCRAYYLILKNILNNRKLENSYEIGTSEGIRLKNALIMLNKKIKNDVFLNFNKIPNRIGERNSTANINNLNLLGWMPKKKFKHEINKLI